MKTIIVPLDFSNESLTGLDLAIMLAKKTGAGIQLAHVILKSENKSDESVKEERQKADLKFEVILKKYKEKAGSKTSLRSVVKEGKIFEEITKLADQAEDSLIVLSTHGESGFEELFIGGNAYKITSHSKNPVITVRRCNIAPTIRKIVLPLDITFETREKVPYTAEIAKLFHSEVHVLTVRQTDNKSIEKKLNTYSEQVTSYLAHKEIPYKTESLIGGNITDIILEYARSVDADLISIMTEQERSMSNLLLGSYAHQMINKAYIPVLSFPNYQLRVVADDIWSLGAFNPRN